MNGTIPHDAIRNLAYQLWQQRGCQGGSPEDDWRRAEEILRNQEVANTTGGAPGERQKATEKVDHAVEESFPASDPPAVHSTDEPPVNAGAKWKAAKAAKVARDTGRRGAPA